MDDDIMQIGAFYNNSIFYADTDSLILFASVKMITGVRLCFMRSF